MRPLFSPNEPPGDAHADISSPARLRNIWARSKTILKHFNMSGMRNEGNHLDYRAKIAHHLKLFYGKTFKEGSYWYTHPNENEFFRAVFAKAAGKENADDVDAAEGKIITGWMQPAVERRARAMKCFEELERIMREQEQAYEGEINSSFPVAPTTLG